MKISEILSRDRRTLSFEVFPPKKVENFDSVLSAAEKIAALSPDYMSVTYGAGGGTSKYTADLASRIEGLGVTALAHLTCVSSSAETVRTVLSDLRAKKIDNILALRGDIPEGFDRASAEYKYASELIEEIREFGGFCIGGACYPEGHPESLSREADLAALRRKVECGCQFLTTQMFFDNRVFFRFAEELSALGASVPLIAGIMPITSATQVEKMIKFSGSALPVELCRIIDRYGADNESMREAGIDYASRQIREIWESGFKFAHVYSMNKPQVAADIKKNLEFML
jgi:methylenetetrahydrofolate reductase (NADPH)